MTKRNIVITGTFSLGWTDDIVQSLCALGIDAIGDHPSLQDPFALLLHRIEHPDAVYVTSLTDTVYHPQVVTLLRELASLLLPSGPWIALDLQCDHDTLFDVCIQKHRFRGTFDDLYNFQKAPPYIHVHQMTTYTPPPYCADTPELMALFLLGLKELFAGYVS